MWFVYIVQTRYGTLYTGITTDVSRRFQEHESGRPRGARALRGKGPLTLVFSARVGERKRAARLEWQIKQWPRARKDALVRGEITLPGPGQDEP